MFTMARTVVVGIPLAQNYKVDARLKDTVSLWEKTQKVEVYHPVSLSPETGRDMVVEYAKYRVPSPTHILFMDADVLPRRNTLTKLLSHDKDIVMGVYPISQGGELLWSVSRSETFEGLEELPRNPFKIVAGGFGMTLVKFEVFERLEWPYWKNIYSPGTIEMSEDIYFCQKAAEAGYDIWCDPLVKCNHQKYIGLLNIVNKIAFIRKELNNGSNSRNNR